MQSKTHAVALPAYTDVIDFLVEAILIPMTLIPVTFFI